MRTVLLTLALCVPLTAEAVGFGAFSVSSAKLKVSGRRTGNDVLIVSGAFVLGPGNNGANPSSESVRLGVGPFSQTIAPPAFTVSASDNVSRWRFTSRGAGISAFRIKRMVSRTLSERWSFEAESDRVDLSGTTNPVTFSLQIGDDGGTQTVTMTTEATRHSTMFKFFGHKCGNGIVDEGEQCDPGPDRVDDCCTASCRFTGSGSTCRAATGACDAAEVCTGQDASCPADTKRTDVCRPAAGTCDVAESCDGSSNDCPTDKLATSGSVCRAAAGACDVAESCSGTGPSCPPDGFATSATACRPSAGDCDAAESCTGSSASCPTDAKRTDECRAAAGACDVAERCDGASNACPADHLASAGSVCRAAVGACDVAEACTGTSAQCPTDALAPSGTECRAAAGDCDVTEACAGTSSACPTDAKRTGECRAAAGACDVAERCDGSANACPTDEFVSAGTSCRPAAGECDLAESCTGSGPSCPADAKRTDECRPASGMCDLGEQCDGTHDACPANTFVSAGTECRPSAGICDVAEACTGSTADCPSDSFAGTAVTCRSAVGACDVAETCNGGSATCPADQHVTNGTPCPDGTFCNGAETCQGGTCASGSPPCPANQCDEGTSTCRSCGDGIVDPGEQCDPAATSIDCAEGEACQPDCTCSTLPTVHVTAPANLSLFPKPAVTVTGTTQRAISIACAGVPGTLAGDGSFAIDLQLHEGRNAVSCVARSSDEMAAVDTVQLVLDTTPPSVVIESPPKGFITTSAQVDVTGTIADPGSVAVEAVAPTVMVNGVQAEVMNRAFVVPGFLLQPGVNSIRVAAMDGAGNVGTSELEITLLADVEQRLQQLAGSGQVGVVGEVLAEPLSVRLTDRRGNPVAGRLVTFAVTRGDGSVEAFPNEGREVGVPTDENGIASVRFRVGTRRGAGNHEVTASIVGVPGSVVFCASAEGLAPQRIVTVVGSGQTGAVGMNLPLPMIAFVTDAMGNPVPGVDVRYDVVAGGGSIGGAATFTDTTDSEGRTSAVMTLGAMEGINNNVVNATFDGLTESPATFVNSALAMAPEPATTISGLVVDNSDEPVPGATASVNGTMLSAVADDQGRFTIRNVPVGAVVLIVDGTTTSRPGDWPLLDFQLVTVSGRDNGLGMPIRLPILDTPGSKIVGGPEDVTIQMKDVPGAELTVFANSVTFHHDGSHVGRVSFTQVHTDKVPMPAPLGSHFMVAFSIQPPGAHFNPPARISIPNMGSPPGAIVEMFSFDHDIGEFVSIGTATVTADGSRAVSDPGFGITKSGWGGCVPPPPPDGCGDGCEDGDVCNGLRACMNNMCVDTAPPLNCADDDDPCTPERCDPSKGCLRDDGNFNPDFWNDGGINAPVQGHNNCYAYATRMQTNTFPQPGAGSGHPFTEMTCGAVSAAATSDGLDPHSCDSTCPVHCHKVALVVWPPSPCGQDETCQDYHWYREDNDGSWSHKPGSTEAKNVDDSGRPISDPRTANRGPYTDFCGCFCVCCDETIQ